MTTSKNNEQEQAIANQAWEKMQARLQQEPVNPVWATWKEADFKQTEQGASAFLANSAEDQNNQSAKNNVHLLQDSTANILTSKKNKKRGARIAFAAAAAAVIATAVTPVGNQALASILNKFTMQDAVVVQQSELDNMRQMIYNIDDDFQTANIYGDFSSSPLNEFGEKDSVEQIREKLGYTPIVGPQGTEGRLSAAIGTKTEMKLDVNEVNEMLRKLGAEYLFPQEANDKSITMTYPARVIYNFGNDSDSFEADTWAILDQSDMPTVEFDESFPVEQTMEAVMNFPYLPEELRSSLQKTAVSSGKLPLPMFERGQAKSFDVSGVKVTYTEEEGGTRSAFWIKNNQLFEFNAAIQFKGGEAGFLDFVKGLAVQ
ncbi:hypothetical protein [Saccharibacillus sp. JS10]|uniref:hypothetical protein n=1 Tax=Saccharibacillus sp. JS10 TaxID=2950552 RepID=UPI00210B54A4|nr:hypothetical protein [Saccharibacillus sp. JS10]MCQ4085305.1 hypothetical protein [Saccharibacillus sp. JS10]